MFYFAFFMICLLCLCVIVVSTVLLFWIWLVVLCVVLRVYDSCSLLVVRLKFVVCAFGLWWY